MLNGKDALLLIRGAGFVHLPVIAVTANMTDAAQCLSIGFSAFLSKPCRKEILRDKIKELIDIDQARRQQTPTAEATSTQATLSPNQVSTHMDDRLVSPLLTAQQHNAPPSPSKTINPT